VGSTPNFAAKTLHRREGEVSFPPLEEADVGPVVTEDVGEGFLTEFTLFPGGAEVLSHKPLNVTFHAGTVRRRPIQRLSA
jgi:hypothetical protein